MAWRLDPVCLLQTLAVSCTVLSGNVQGEKVVATVELPASTLPGEPAIRIDVLDGEDAASSAQRYAESLSLFNADAVLTVAKAVAEQLQDVDGYKPPKDLVLRTGGAYSRRSDEKLKAKQFSEAAADCLRALMRPGIDSTAIDVFMKKLEHALYRMEKIREMQAEAAAENNEKYAEQQAEADALAKEWSALLGADEAAWQGVDNHVVSAAVERSLDSKEVVGVDMTLGKDGAEGKSVRISVREGDDESASAFHFCAANNVRAADQVLDLHSKLTKEMKQSKYEAPSHLKLSTAPEYLERGREHEAAFDFGAAGSDYARGLKVPSATQADKDELKIKLENALEVYSSVHDLISSWEARKCEAVVEKAAKVPSTLRSDPVQLIIARCYANVKRPKESIATITSLLNQCDKSGSWQDTEIRTIAALSGAIQSLRLGDIEKAKKMYQLVLRADPDQKYVSKRYKALKAYNRILGEIEELIKQSKNHDVMKAVERSQRLLEQVMGKEGAASAGTKLLLFECNAKSAIKFHDDALEACNTAIEQFENHDNPDPRKIAEAFAWRAEANMRDKSFDEAVADLQVSTTKVPNNQDYQQKLNEAKREQSEWNKSEEMKGRRGEKLDLGHFYVNRPSVEILDLPENIEELETEDRCGRLKGAFRKMSLRWHPDKAKGGKKRAQRKSSELGEAKMQLEAKWNCKGKRR